nr:hypothetical protein HK105_000744 [Polyrhizophydium stewartii]
MSCTHVDSARLSSPTPASKVYKDECTLCFDSLDGPDGINVCLTCFNGGCGSSGRNHAQLHVAKSGHPLVINIRRTKKATARDTEQPPQKITKLAIQEEDDSAKYDIATKVVCLACGGVEVDRTLPKVQVSADGVLAALSAKKQSEIQAWQEETLKPCSHTGELVQTEPRKLEGKENLWLCLTCGNLGCGRAQYGGVGGNGHALAHHETTGHPIAVKMGSITPEGTADLFCYLHGDEIINPNLGAHLANFGINLLSQQKTEKSIAELQLEQNLKFDFSMTTEDGKQLTPVFGPGLTGLKNLGNSCYMASVLQSLFAVDAVKQRYEALAASHSQNCHESSAECFHCQMGKVADGLLSGRYSTPITGDDGEKRGQDGISPSMFKSLVGRGHPEFSTMRQQDAQEFLQHLLSIIEQKERAGGNDPSSAFRFKIEQRLQCLECEGVRYKSDANSVLILPVKATVMGEIDGKKQYAPVSFHACLEQHFEADIRQYQCPHDKQQTSASFVQRFKTFPQIITFAMARFVLGEGWVMEKLNADLQMPTELDLSAFRASGKQEGETLLPDDGPQSSGPQIDEAALNQLLAMGFPENRCKRAIVKTGNQGPDVAMNWLFEHMDDPDIDAPLEDASGGPAASEDDVAQLMDMGFTAAQAKRALRETSNNMERAVDWLFSHAGEPMDEDNPAGQNSAGAAAAEDAVDQGSAKYDLLSFISHRGTSAHCGHYVSYVKHDGRWILFNDNKVVEIPDITSHLGEGYIYFFKRRG